MGCVQAKSSSYSPSYGLDKLKTENGYVGRGGGGGRRRSLSQNQSGKEPERVARQDLKDTSAGVALGGGGGEGSLLTRDGEKATGVSMRISVSRRVGDDELVGGWPKWLVDNIPRESLIGLVPKSADSYNKLDKIGHGTYSNVYKARDLDTGKIVALKKVRFDTSESESVKFMAREIIILQKLNHPNIIKLEGLATSRMHYSLYLVFDFMQTDLARVISRRDLTLTEPQIKSYTEQLLSGLQHCHERGILHRDIKASNLLIDKNGMLKIADFGLANDFLPNQKHPLTSRVVTLWYRAPELLLGATDYGVGIDLWSVGCLVAEMFAGRPLMPGRTEVEQLHRIFKLVGSPPEDYWKRLKLSPSFRPPQPYKPSILETFKDLPSSSLGLLSTLLALDPDHRGTAYSSLQSEFFSTSPLACDLSGLPVIYKEEDESTQTDGRRRGRNTKTRHRPRLNSQSRGRESSDKEKSKWNYNSSKEDHEKYTEPNFTTSQELGSSTGTTSSSVKPGRHEESTSPSDSNSSIIKPSMRKKGMLPSLSPDISYHLKRSSRTECHPNALKNVKNLPSLPTSKSSADSQDSDNIYRYRDLRCASAVDYRKFDRPKISTKRYAYDD